MLSKIIKLYPSFISRLYTNLRKYILPIQKIEKYIPKKGTVLDVGCGYGLTSIYFALKSKNRKVIGLDLDKKRIIDARKASKNIDGFRCCRPIMLLAHDSKDIRIGANLCRALCRQLRTLCGRRSACQSQKSSCPSERSSKSAG